MSIRARLVLLVLAIALPALSAALLLVAGTWALAHDIAAAPPRGWALLLDPRAGAWPLAGTAALLIALALAAALWVSRRIAVPLEMLQAAARQLQQGRPVQPGATGIAECDKALASLAAASHTLHDARDELEQQVEQAVLRTREAEQRAGRSQRIEALGRLTGGVAHDFNNLLGVVSNSAYLIQRQAAPGEHTAALAAILRSVEAGHRMTQHLLRFAGRKPVRPQALDLRQHLLAMDELIRTVLGSRVRFRSQVSLDTRQITVDAAELELALINLALNARDAMPRGGEVLLRACNAGPDDIDDMSEPHAAGGPTGTALHGPGSPGGEWVLITFDDSGCGITEEAACHVFEPFFTTKAVGKGTGLGLAQVRGFCVQAGGMARLASTPGLGTTVSLLLPASRGAELGAAPQTLAGSLTGLGAVPGPSHAPSTALLSALLSAAPDTPSTAPPATPSAALHGKRLLLVEDNEELSAVTAALLASFGARVLRVPGADEAMRAVAAQPFDVVLSDVVMPGSMDGLALAHELRRRWPHLPVLLVSGYSSALAGGACDFEVLAKPCAPETLLAALQRVMQPVPALVQQGS